MGVCVSLDYYRIESEADFEGVALSGADRDRTDYLLNAIQSL